MVERLVLFCGVFFTYRRGSGTLRAACNNQSEMSIAYACAAVCKRPSQSAQLLRFITLFCSRPKYFCPYIYKVQWHGTAETVYTGIFLQHGSIASCASTVIVTACLFVCPLHPGIVSKGTQLRS